MIDDIRKHLLSMQDEKYRSFQVKLFPTVDPQTVIGVRTPELRSYAKKLLKEYDISAFLSDLPHRYFDENQLHAFILSELKDYEKCMQEVNRFLPYVDNWATCDQMSPKVFKKHRPQLLEQIRTWLKSEKTYTIRFAIGMLMEHYLDDASPRLWQKNQMLFFRSSRTENWMSGLTTRQSRKPLKAIESHRNRKNT